MTTVMEPAAPAGENAEAAATNGKPSSNGRALYVRPTSQDRDPWLTTVAVVGGFVALIALVWSAIAWGMSGRAQADASKALKAKAAGSSAAAAVAPEATKVHLSEYKIDPEMVTATTAGGLDVINNGTAQHDLVIEGTQLATVKIDPGQVVHMDLSSLAPGTYSLLCNIAGHAEAGMRGMLHLSSATTGTSASAAAATTPTTAAMTVEQMDKVMHDSTVAFPAKTAGLGAQPLAPTILADGTKQFELTSEVVQWETSPGKFVEAWTYNGTVPGPTIKVNVGDKVKIVLHNKLPEATVIHFHGLEVPNAMDGVPYITQDPVDPGHDFTYSFVAKGPAVGMYHSHFNAQKQVSDGLAGAILVGDEPVPAGVQVSQQQVMMLNDSGTIGLTVNGKSFPATSPIVAKLGDWVEVQYMNEGTMIHPMHLHGIPQVVIAKDGFPLANPETEDTVMVAPGERYTVLVHATDLGIWAWHCHILTHAENDTGMFGMVTALVVK